MYTPELRFAAAAISLASIASVCATASCAELNRNGIAFEVVLSHQEAVQIETVANSAASIISDPMISPLITAQAALIKLVDGIGGNNGVRITGVLGDSQVIITPHNAPVYGPVIAELGNAANQLQRGWGHLSHVLENTSADISSKLDSGWRKVSGQSRQQPRADNDPRRYLRADRDSPDDNCNFLFVGLGGDEVGILTPAGWLQAENGGGNDSKARTKAMASPGSWESWHMETWSDGAVSFLTKNKSARLGIAGDGLVWSDVSSNPSAPPPPAKFRVEFGVNGKVRLFSERLNKYVRAE